MTALPAWAASFDVSLFSSGTVDLNAIATQVYPEYSSGVIYDQSIAVIGQNGGGIIVVDQSNTTGNFAAIIQDATINGLGAAHISQSSNGNFALIRQ